MVRLRFALVGLLLVGAAASALAAPKRKVETLKPQVESEVSSFDGFVEAAALSCNALAEKVQASGAVSVILGRSGFERVVRDGAFCPVEQSVTRPEYVQTADVSQCFVGYLCRDNNRDSTK